MLRGTASAATAARRSHLIDLYAAPAPNGWKSSITREELGIPYRVHPIDLGRNEQRERWCLEINPNGRIPAIVDRAEGDFPEKIPAAIQRYQNETRRLYGVLDRQLEGREFLTGAVGLADIANYTWVRIHGWAGVDVEGLANLQAWMEWVGYRPAVQKGCQVPMPVKLGEVEAEDEAVLETARRILQR